MSNRIVSIGEDLPGEGTEFCSMKSEQSLLDYDIAIFHPVIRDFHDYLQSDHQGKTLLSKNASFSIRESFNRWKMEILEFLRSGKNVFCFLYKKEDIFIHTGKSEFSGTGRNQKTTNLVEPFSNYDFLPINIQVMNSTGKQMRLSKCGEIVESYLSDLQKYLVYNVYIEGDAIHPLIMTKTGNKIVGAFSTFKDIPGTLFLLPGIGFNHDSFLEERDDDVFWTKEALIYSNKIISAIVRINQSSMGKSDATPFPVWLKQDKYVTLKEQSITSILIEIEKKINVLRTEKMRITSERDKVTAINGLLYETGVALEKSILNALQVIGFKADQYQDDKSEFDVVFESPEGRFLGEAEGKDNKQINIDKLRQLHLNIHEDYNRESVCIMAKGVLFGNAYRLSEPCKRGDFFTDKCIQASKQNNIALVKTTDLYHIAKYLTDYEDIGYATECRTKIFNSSGLVVFPPIPETASIRSVLINSE